MLLQHEEILLKDRELKSTLEVLNICCLLKERKRLWQSCQINKTLIEYCAERMAIAEPRLRRSVSDSVRRRVAQCTHVHEEHISVNFA